MFTVAHTLRNSLNPLAERGTKVSNPIEIQLHTRVIYIARKSYPNKKKKRIKVFVFIHPDRSRLTNLQLFTYLSLRKRLSHVKTIEVEHVRVICRLTKPNRATVGAA